METLFNNGKSLTNPQRYPNPNETNEVALSTNQPNASVHSLVVDSDHKEKIYIYILYLLYLFHSSRHSMMLFLYSVPIDNEPPLVHGNITEKLVMFFCFVCLRFGPHLLLATHAHIQRPIMFFSVPIAPFERPL